MIWLVGCNGMLGSEVRAALDQRRIAHVDSDKEVDIADPRAVRGFLLGQRAPLEWILNCAAYTAVDKAEDDSEMAYRVNASGAAVLAEAAGGYGAAIVHLSTDYVFDGRRPGAYVEEDAPSPLGVYGLSKLAGEEAVRAACPRSYIVRTSWLFGKGGWNFVSTMLRLAGEGKELRVVADQWGRPTYAVDLAGVLADLVSAHPEAWGTYHYCNHGRTSWHGFAEAILAGARARRLVRPEVHVSAVTTPEYPTRARRPANSELSTAKIESTFGIDIPPWEDALGRYLDALAQGVTP